MKDCCVCVSVCLMCMGRLRVIYHRELLCIHLHVRILFRCDIYLRVVSLRVSAYMHGCSSHSGSRAAPKQPEPEPEGGKPPLPDSPPDTERPVDEGLLCVCVCVCCVHGSSSSDIS